MFFRGGGCLQFIRDRSGSMVPLMAVALLCLIGGVGIAIDTGRAYSVRQAMQHNLDAAVMAAALDLSQGNSNVSESAQLAFNARWASKHDAGSVAVTAQPDGSGGVSGTAELTMPAVFMRVFGFKNLPVRAESAAAVGMGSQPIEIVLVLDNTGSMAGQKMADLKAAATELVDIVLNSANVHPDTKISLVPFSNYVNVGMGHRNEPWIDVPPDTTTTSVKCEMERPIISKTNCRIIETTTTCSSTNDGVTTSWTCTYQEELCDIVYGAAVEVCKTDTDTVKWEGCVGSRNYPLNVQDGGYSTRIPGIMDESCSAPVTPLTNDKAVLNSSINAMRAENETYIPAGLVWGWRMVSPQAPFSEGIDPATVPAASKPRKIVVLMTDGANTLSPDYPEHDDNDTVLADKLTTELCQNIKADGISLYTIGFDITNPSIQSLLASCASGPPYYFSAATGMDLANAFKAVANNLSTVKFTK